MNRMRRHDGVAAQRGLSLIEVMIAVTLGLLLMAGVFSVYLSNRQSALMGEALASRQEAIRYVSARIAQDARMAGFRGCRADTFKNDNDNPVHQQIAPDDGYLYRHARQAARYVEGHDGDGASWSPALPAGISEVVSGTDVLTLRISMEPELYLHTDISSMNATEAIDAQPRNPAVPLHAGDLAVIGDCNSMDVFLVTAYDPASGAIAHTQAAEGAAGNVAASICGGRASCSYKVADSVTINRLATVSYFIRASTGGSGPALWRMLDDDAPVEIAQGIDNLQVQYGEDTDDDGVADTYRDAGAFASNAAWQRVRTIRVALLVSGTQDKAGQRDDRSFDLLGTTVGPFGDGRLRRAITLTLALRNRLP